MQQEVTQDITPGSVGDIADIDYYRLLLLLRKNAKYCIFLIVLSLFLAYLLLRYTIPIYESSTTIQVTITNTARSVLEMEKSFEKPDISVAAELLSSPFLFKRAIKKLPLQVSYYNKGSFLSHELYKTSPFEVTINLHDSSYIGQPFFLRFINPQTVLIHCPSKGIEEQKANANHIAMPGITLHIFIKNYEKIQEFQNTIKQQEFMFVINDWDLLSEKLIKNLTVSIVNYQANSIKISFRDNNPQKAADIANAIAEEFKLYDLENRSQSSRQVLHFLEEQLSIAYNKLKESENIIRAFKKENKLSDTYQINAGYLDQLRKFEDEVINLNFKIATLKELQKKLGETYSEQEVTQLLAIIGGDVDLSQTLATYIETLKTLFFNKQKLLAEASEKNQIIQSLNHQIQLQKKLIYETIASKEQMLERSRDEVMGKIRELENFFSNVPEREIEYARLQRVYTIDEKFFNLLLEKKTEFSIAEAGFVPQHLILDRAIPSALPVYPNKKLIVLTFFAGGILLSTLLILFQYLFDNKVHSLQELEKMLKNTIPVLGAVPKYKRNIPNSQLVIDNNPKSLMAESFRNIRSNLQFINNDPGSKIIAVTSTISGEGKTFIAINLAAIFAYSGKKVIILDLDMRKPKIHIGFKSDNSYGMSSLLIGAKTIEETVRSSEMENLYYITSGPIPPNPSELIINGNFPVIIDELKKKYDFIIIDNPPIGLVSDAILPLQISHYPIYVMRSDYSKKVFTENVLKLYRDYHIRRISVVLNGVDLHQNRYGYYYGYGYGYSYHSHYYIDDTVDRNSWKDAILAKIRKTWKS